jgi:integrase
MASLYKRPGSPFFWLKPKRGKARSTKLRTDVMLHVKRAQEILRKQNETENLIHTEPERWECWVPQYIQERYEGSPKSLQAYLLRWRSLTAFLIRHKVQYPNQLTFNLMTQYVAWRRAGDIANGVRAASKNTAIWEVKFMGLVMRRAIQLGFATVNPCAGLGLQRLKPEPKWEFTDAHIQLIWEKLQAEAEWMRVNFLICLHTGCRLREAAVPLDCVNLETRFIHFPDTKGDKPFTVPLRDDLIPLFQRLKRERPGQAAFDMPRMPSKEWWAFFRRIGLPQYCMHGLRVTFISRLARAKVPMSEAMKLVNHASEEIHRIYQRFEPEDLRESLAKAKLPSLTIQVMPERSDAPRSTAA